VPPSNYRSTQPDGGPVPIYSSTTSTEPHLISSFNFRRPWTRYRNMYSDTQQGTKVQASTDVMVTESGGYSQVKSRGHPISNRHNTKMNLFQPLVLVYMDSATCIPREIRCRWSSNQVGRMRSEPLHRWFHYLFIYYLLLLLYSIIFTSGLSPRWASVHYSIPVPILFLLSLSLLLSGRRFHIYATQMWENLLKMDHYCYVTGTTLSRYGNCLISLLGLVLMINITFMSLNTFSYSFLLNERIVLEFLFLPNEI